MRNGQQIIFNQKENACGKCKGQTWLNIIDLDLNKNSKNFCNVILKMIIIKKNFYQDSQDLWNGDKKEEKWDRKKKSFVLRKKIFKSLKSQLKNLKKIKL